MNRHTIAALRGLLVLLAAGSLAVQVVITVVAVLEVSGGGRPLPGVAYVVVAVLAIGCVQVGLFAIWVLLAMVRRDAIFDERAFRWVPVVGVAGLVAAVLIGAVCMHAGEFDDAPGLILIGGGIVLAGVAFALLMTVMLGLLRSATVLRRELEQVV